MFRGHSIPEGGAAEADHDILFPRRMHTRRCHTCVLEPAVRIPAGNPAGSDYPRP